MSVTKQTAVEYLVSELFKPIKEKQSENVTVLIKEVKDLEKKQKDNFALDFVCWLMENCELISDKETGENVLWRYDSEDYILDTLLEIFKDSRNEK